ncbi:MAG: arginine--tRNA ligase [Chitinophagaceae bacterium]|nr:arginine--tRNA ligase [Chitinophagaceae bacterium]
MWIVKHIQQTAIESLNQIFGQTFTEKDFQINQTKPEFDGDYTIVLFSLVKALKLSPDDIGNKLGDHLTQNNPTLFTDYNIIKGFLNLTVADSYWLDLLAKNYNDVCYGKAKLNGQKVMVEYSSPNTNKPLHLGHLRNNFLGWSVAEILKASGYDVIKTCIVNDRGIHICKSMIAWQLFGNGATPQSENKKGDHFVGEYYVKFNDELKKQIHELKDKGINEKEAEKEAPIMKATQQMLLDWEAGKPEVMQLWKTMNSWVYEGFDTTYKKIGSDFNKTYYESNTYLLGKKIVEEGLAKGVFFKEDDNSVWIDLTTDGLDKKIVQRKDGTSVYITQDIGLAQQKYEEYGIDQSIYVIGDEQNYHMKVLKLIAEKLQLPNAQNIYHLSYGMVELPTGKMKSREGTVVDADDIVQEMENVAKNKTEELGKVKDFTAEELETLYTTIGLGALKFFLLRVDPKKKMIFNPEESIDFHGFTGPFVQYTHARIKSILRKEEVTSTKFQVQSLLPLEKKLMIILEQYATVIDKAANEHNPSEIAIYVFEVAKIFNSFYAEHSITNAETPDKKQLRLQLASLTATVLKSGMQLLGIGVPERM